MARPSKHDGAVYKRNDGKILWITYRDRDGKRVRKSAFTEDWQDAQRKLRERLQARDAAGLQGCAICRVFPPFPISYPRSSPVRS
jgi:hypothetical protein